MAERHRNGRGDFALSAADHERDAECARLQALGYTYRQIGSALGIPTTTAFQAVRRVHRAAGAEARDQIRESVLSRIEAVAARMEEIADSDHYAVAQGRVVYDEEGNPVLDQAPVIAAAKVLLDTARDVRKLMGIDEPVRTETKVDGTQTVSYKITGADPDKI